MKRKVKLTPLGEQLLVFTIMSILVLGTLFYQSFVRIPQIERYTVQK